MKRLAAIAFATRISTAASAAPIHDIQSWAQRFTPAALKTDTDAILALSNKASGPGLALVGLPQILESARSVIGGQTADNAERNIGTCLKRIDIAVR